MIEWIIKTDKIGVCVCGNTVPCFYKFCPQCGIILHEKKEEQS